MTNLKAAIFDIDGTLARVNWRMGLMEFDWDEFLYQAIYDEVNKTILGHLNSLHSSSAILLVTGRDETQRHLTNMWLDKVHIRREELYMRRADDERPDDVVKAEIYHNDIKQTYSVRIAVDDRRSVANMWRKNLELDPDGHPPTVYHCDDKE